MLGILLQVIVGVVIRNSAMVLYVQAQKSCNHSHTGFDSPVLRQTCMLSLVFGFKA